MKIEIGKLYENRTQKYLFPCIRAFGSTFISKFNLVFKLAYGVHDKLLDGSHLDDTTRKLCILIDRKVKPHDYDNFIRWIKHQEYYLTDYSYDDGETGRQQMLVLAFPFGLEHVYDAFKEGKYSKMYPFEEVETYFKTETPQKGVIMRSVEAKENFMKLINGMYNTNLKISEIDKDTELDLPWKVEEEIFNN